MYDYMYCSEDYFVISSLRHFFWEENDFVVTLLLLFHQYFQLVDTCILHFSITHFLAIFQLCVYIPYYTTDGQHFYVLHLWYRGKQYQSTKSL